MAAFDHVSALARETYLTNLRTAFLANPQNYNGGDANWAELLYPADLIYCNFAASGGAGTIGNPYGYADWRSNQRPNSRTIFTGNHRGDRLQVQSSTQTLDIRGCTVSPGNTIPSGDIINVSGNVYKVTNQSLIDFNDCRVGVCIRQFDQNNNEYQNYYGLSRMQSGDAGSISLTGALTDGTLTLATPWKLTVNDVIAVVVSATTGYTSPVGGLSSKTPYYVVSAGAFNTTTGVQTIQISATQGGSVITFTAPQVTALLTPSSGTAKLQLFSLYQNHSPGTGAPQAASLQPLEFAYRPDEPALYFRTPGPLTGDYDVVVSSTQTAGVDIGTAYSNVQVLGGTVLTAHRPVFMNGGTDKSAWGTKVVGGYRGIVQGGNTTRARTRYCDVRGSRYALANEGANPPSGETYTSHKWFIVGEAGNRVLHCDDRQLMMLNPQSDNSEIRFGLVKDGGLQSYLGFTPPAKQISPNTSSWGQVVDDTASNIAIEGVYFHNVFGEMVKLNSGAGYGIANVDVSRCIFDWRGQASGDVKGRTSIWNFAKDGTDGPLGDVVNLTGTGNVHLIGSGAISQPEEAAGRKATAMVCSLSSAGFIANSQIDENIIYGAAAGAESVVHLIQSESGSNPDAVINAGTDFNQYCLPNFAYLALKVGTGGGTAWSTLGTIKSSVAMPVTPGAVTPWTSGSKTNDANSQVLTETQMAAVGLLYGADGFLLPATTGTVARPGWTLKRSA